MKNLSSSLIAILALVLFASPAYAKHPPGWDTQINDPSRFQVLKQFNNEAVLDKETGLVWEQSPLTITDTWPSIRFECQSRTVGGRKGWRMPSMHELASLVDPSNAFLALPTGHPFSNVLPSFYWTATSSADFIRDHAWVASFADGLVGTTLKTTVNGVWCVRGGGPLSVY